MSASAPSLFVPTLRTPSHARTAAPAKPRPRSLWAGYACSTVSLGKYGSFKTDKLIGQPYGHTYEIVGEELRIVRATIAEIQETAANNQNILSNGVGLDNDRIKAMKAEGLTGRVSLLLSAKAGRPEVALTALGWSRRRSLRSRLRSTLRSSSRLSTARTST